LHQQRAARTQTAGIHDGCSKRWWASASHRREQYGHAQTEALAKGLSA
jgi:hypothetical protein